MDEAVSLPTMTANAETVESVLCALERWTARNDGHHTEKRGTQRHFYRARIEVAAQHYS